MAKSDLPFPSDGYAPVSDRVRLFYERFPAGRIITELVSRTERDVVFRALIYRSVDEREPAATGWAAEREGDGDVNTVACLENTETSAVGRALANLGLTGSRERPSAEEMAKASRARARLAVPGRPPPRADGTPRLRVAEPNAGTTVVGQERDAARPAPVRAHATAGAARSNAEALHASVTHEIARLLSAAQRAGVRPARLARWRERLAERRHPIADLLRVERRLRAWIAEKERGR